ncbi:MAG: hypothetical protein ABSH34_34545 [Verrucomicrobiota bacterium]
MAAKNITQRPVFRQGQFSRKVGILGACQRLLLLAVRRVKEAEDCRYS